MADLNDLTANVNLWNDEKSKSVTVTTDDTTATSRERLDVDSYARLVGKYGSGDDDIDYVSMDSATNTLQTINYGHHEVHGGSAYTAWVSKTAFKKKGELGILLTTPDTGKWLHIVESPYAAGSSLFQIWEGTVTYDETATNAEFGQRDAYNRNRNSSNTSGILSVEATPVAGDYSYFISEDATNVDKRVIDSTAAATLIHQEIVGTDGNKGGHNGARDAEEIILKQNTMYLFRIIGEDVSDNLPAGITLTWYEHTNKH